MVNRTDERKPTANSTLAIGGVSSPFDSFVVKESSVLRTNFCAEKPAHRQSAKRYPLNIKTLQERMPARLCSRMSATFTTPTKNAYQL